MEPSQDAAPSLFNVRYNIHSEGHLRLDLLSEDAKRKLQEARAQDKPAIACDRDFAIPCNNIEVKAGDILLVNGRYARVDQVNSVSVSILLDGYCCKVDTTHLKQIAKKLPKRIPIVRKPNAKACETDLVLATPVKDRFDMLLGQYVLCSDSDATWRYARITKVMSNEVFVALGDNEKKIQKNLWSLLIQKIPVLDAGNGSQRKISTAKAPDINLGALERKTREASSKIREGKTLYEKQAFPSEINEKTGNVVLITPLGKIEVHPMHVSEFDPEKDCGKLIQRVSPRSTFSANRLNTNVKEQILRLEYRMKQMGIEDKWIINHIHYQFKTCYDELSREGNDCFIAKLAANLIADHRFINKIFLNKPVEGTSSLDAFFFKFLVDSLFYKYAKENAFFKERNINNLQPFLRKLQTIREKLLISSLITQSARTAHEENKIAERDRIINEMIKIMSREIDKALTTPESGAWTAGWPGHSVIAYFRREEQDTSMLRLSIMNSGIGSCYQKLVGDNVISEFRIGNKLHTKFVKENGKTVPSSGYACSGSYIKNILLKQIIPELIRLKVFGTKDEYFDLLERIYRERGDFDSTTAFLRTGVEHPHQLMANCTFTSQLALEDKLAKDAQVSEIIPLYQNYCEKAALGFLSKITMPNNIVYLGNLSTREEISLHELWQICWEKHMALRRSDIQFIRENENPWNQTLGLPLNPPITVDFGELIGSKDKLYIIGNTNSEPFQRDDINQKTLCFDKKIHGGFFHVSGKEMFYTNASNSIILVEKTNKKVKKLAPSKKIEITCGRYKRINLAPEKKEGFFLDLNPAYRHETLNERLFSQLMPSPQAKTNTKS